MPAIITNELRITNGDYFQNDISEIPTYVYFGKTSEWSDETVPDDAIDSTLGRIAALEEVAGLKKVESTDIISVLPRTDWTSGVVYDEYTDVANIIDDKNSETDEFFRFYVVTDEFNVYKCISNNDRSESTIKPAGVSMTPFQTPDGYIWKYMYTIKTEDAFKFMTPNWVPCYSLYREDGSSQWDVQQAAVKGAIQHITVSSSGSGYSDSNPPTVTITGDGSGAQAIARIDDETGTVVGFTITNAGSGYTTATVDITSTVGGGARGRVVISPVNGHGSNARAELGAVYKMIRVTLDGSEGGLLPTNVDYRTSGLLIEPMIAQDGLKLAVGETKFYSIGDTVTGESSGATAQVHSINKIEGALYVTDVVGAFDVNEEISSNEINSTQLQFIEAVDTVPAVNSVLSGSDYVKNSGRIAYISNREKITRGVNQIEEIRLVISF